MNRGEVEHFQAVASICAPNESSQLGRVILELRTCISKSKELTTGGAIELPSDVNDIVQETNSQLAAFIAQYEEKGNEVARSNTAMQQLIMRTMQRSKSSGGEAAQKTSAATKSMDDVKGGVKISG